MARVAIAKQTSGRLPALQEPHRGAHHPASRSTSCGDDHKTRILRQRDTFCLALGVLQRLFLPVYEEIGSNTFGGGYRVGLWLRSVENTAVTGVSFFRDMALRAARPCKTACYQCTIVLLLHFLVLVSLFKLPAMKRERASERATRVIKERVRKILG